MKRSWLQMGMPITVEVIDKSATEEDIKKVYTYFDYVDHKFSTYIKDSEISLFNAKKITESEFSQDMKLIFELAEQTKLESLGYFDIYHNGKYDPSGVVKGWAILNAAHILEKNGFKNFYVEAGGDIQVQGFNKLGKKWSIGIRNPFNHEENIKVLKGTNVGVATSGTAARGQHIYNPHSQSSSLDDIVSITVIGENILEADRFATAAFAMGREGINFIERLQGFEAYMVDKNKVATFTSGFKQYLS